MDRDCVSGDVPGCEEPPPQAELNRAKIKAASDQNDSPLASPIFEVHWTSKSWMRHFSMTFGD